MIEQMKTAAEKIDWKKKQIAAKQRFWKKYKMHELPTSLENKQWLSEPSSLTVSVPDLGGADKVDIIEVLVSIGDNIAEGDGDLSCRIVEKGQDEISAIARAFNLFTGNIQKIIIDINNNDSLKFLNKNQLYNTKTK